MESLLILIIIVLYCAGLGVADALFHAVNTDNDTTSFWGQFYRIILWPVASIHVTLTVLWDTAKQFIAYLRNRKNTKQ